MFNICKYLFLFIYFFSDVIIRKSHAMKYQPIDLRVVDGEAEEEGKVGGWWGGWWVAGG